MAEYEEVFFGKVSITVRTAEKRTLEALFVPKTLRFETKLIAILTCDRTLQSKVLHIKF